jgi:cytochrome P450
MILPLSTPITGIDGRTLDSITIPKSTHLLLGLLATNKDKAIWGEDAHEWKPERWMKPLPETVAKARVPGVYANM